MKLPNFKKWQLITAFVVIVLLITNPSDKAFKDYVDNKAGKRIVYLFVFSVYRVPNGYWDYNDYYIGIANNFIPVYTLDKTTNKSGLF